MTKIDGPKGESVEVNGLWGPFVLGLTQAMPLSTDLRKMNELMRAAVQEKQDQQ